LKMDTSLECQERKAFKSKTNWPEFKSHFDPKKSDYIVQKFEKSTGKRRRAPQDPSFHAPLWQNSANHVLQSRQPSSGPTLSSLITARDRR
jgi:hypothetical protein